MALPRQSDTCAHAGTRRPSRPIPDWSATCPDCGERVKHNGRGGFITVREVNDWLRRQHEAVDTFRRQWITDNPLVAKQ